jgi:predicted MFS family arabinose efflux permease
VEIPVPVLARRALVLLTAVNALSFVDRMILAAVAQPIKTELRLTDTELGMLTGLAFALMYVAAAIPIARLADRVHRPRLVAACLAIWSVMTAACGGAHSFAQLLAARTGVAFGEAACIPAAHALIADLYEPRRRGFALGTFTAGSSIGILAGFVIAGLLADAYGWRAAFLVLGLPGIAVAFAVARLLAEPREFGIGRAAPAGTSVVAAVREVAANPSFLWLVAGVSCGVFTQYGMSQWIPAFLVRSHGYSPGTAATVFGLAYGLGGLAGLLAGGRLVDQLANRDLRWQARLPALLYPLCVPCYAIVLLAPSRALMVGALALGSLIASAAAGAQFAAMMLVVRPTQRATATAISMLIASLAGMGGAPTFIGVLSDGLSAATGAQSLRYAILAALAVPMLASVPFSMAARRIVTGANDAGDSTR